MSPDYHRSVHKCYWLFRWSYQRFILNLRFRELVRLSEDKNIKDDSPVLEKAGQNYAEAEFACKYGRFREKEFRDLIGDIEQQKLATRPELRCLVDGGNIKQNIDGYLRIKAPLLLALFGYIFIGFNLLSIFIFSFLITISPLDLFTKIFLLILFNGIFFSSGSIFKYYAVNPYRIYKKIGFEINQYISGCLNKSLLKLV